MCFTLRSKLYFNHQQHGGIMESLVRFYTFHGTLQIIETFKDIKIPSKGDGYIFDVKRYDVVDVSYEYSDDNVVTIHIKVE